MRGRYNEGDGLVESDGLVFARFSGQRRSAELRLNASARYPDRLFDASPPESFRILDGDAQRASVGQAFERPLSVQAIGASFYKPFLHSVTVGFEADAGLILSSSAAVTDTQGRAEVTVMAGSQPGPHVVIATLNGVSASFVVTVLPSPLIHAITGALAPCGLATVTGVSLPSNLSIAGTTLPILAATADAISFQVPCGIPLGPAELRVGALTQSIVIVAYAPLLFERDGKALAIHADGSPVTAANPAQAGEVIELLASGLGQTKPALVTGKPGAGEVVNAHILVGLGIAALEATATASGEVGVYRVKVQLPETIVTDLIGVAVMTPNGAILHSNPARLDIK
jgi:uncharacterized protein (TIGR03437 family)